MVRYTTFGTCSFAEPSVQVLTAATTVRMSKGPQLPWFLSPLGARLGRIGARRSGIAIKSRSNREGGEDSYAIDLTLIEGYQRCAFWYLQNSIKS